MTPSDKSKSARAAYQHARAALAARPDVTGIDLGYKYVDGVRTKQLAVRVHVQQKRAARQVREAERIPKTLLGVRTDVMQARYRRHGDATPDPSQRGPVVRPGMSIGNPKAEAGTLGLIVTDKETGELCLLSAYHVLVGHFGVPGDPIIQPSRFDHGSIPADTVAALRRSFPPGPWGDAAIAVLNGKRPIAYGQLGSDVRVRRVGLPRLDQVLEKSGRTTGVTRGRVDGMGTYFYPGAEQGVGGFHLVPADIDDPDTQDLSAPGDSGSVYYDPKNRTGVGLHCAGDVDSPGGESAVACYLTRVFNTLGLGFPGR
jgi:endonuclease G